jgi:flagellar hook-associated protein 3 FlgL
MADGQSRLAAAQAEVTTGRYADVGLALGARTGTSIALRIDLDLVTTTLERTAQARVEAGVSQASLSNLTKLAQGFQSMLGGARTAENGKFLAAASAQSSIDAMITTLSTTYEGRYIFGGLMTQSAPITPYAVGPRQAIVTAFETRFGFAPSDPAAAGLSVAELRDFIDNDFAALFGDAEWSSTWSSATDEAPLFRLRGGSEVNLHTTANQPFARTLAQAFAMVEVLGSGSIGQQAFEAVADRALARVTEAQMHIGAEQARIGSGESRLKLEVDRLETTELKFTSAIRELEGVDAYEAAARVNSLMTQLEASYALTARIGRMSLLSYI